MDHQAHVLAGVTGGCDRSRGVWGRQQLTVDAAFADTARDQAGILRAEVEHEHGCAPILNFGAKHRRIVKEPHLCTSAASRTWGHSGARGAAAGAGSPAV